MDKIDWHAGFVSAMKLDLIEDEKNLIFQEEYYIANRAQRIDLLIIKKNRNVQIHSPIGAMFGKYNVCEYKSPSDSLNYKDFYKTLAYTCLYLNESKRKQVAASDYTMTFVRDSYPRELIKKIKAEGIRVDEIIPGIYELTNNLPFRTQIIVTGMIPDEYRLWLKYLSTKNAANNLKSIVDRTPHLSSQHKEYADSVMDVFTKANRTFMEKMKKEAPKMCKAVNELFADEIAEKDKCIAEKDKRIAEKDKRIAELEALLAEYTPKRKSPKGRKNVKA